jgi:hypothetical protein
MGSTKFNSGTCPLCGGVVETFSWSDHYDVGTVTYCKECKTEYDPKNLVDGKIGLKAALDAKKEVSEQ